jgi:hypothetical protein
MIPCWYLARAVGVVFPNSSMHLEILENLTDDRSAKYAYYKTHRAAINKELQRKTLQQNARLREDLMTFSATDKVSQSDLAGVLELSQAEISRIKSGKRGLGPQLTVADKLRLFLVRK